MLCVSMLVNLKFGAQVWIVVAGALCACTMLESCVAGVN